MMIEVVCQKSPDKPDRANEDAFVAYQRDDGQPQIVLAAIDGATSVAQFAPLQDYLDTKRNGITPAGLAATVARDAIVAQLGEVGVSNDDLEPRQLILKANDVLRDLLTQVASEIFDAKKLLGIQPEFAPLLDDPRKIRLFLPAAVLTVATIDINVGLLRFAHAGDTALLICYEDGHVEIPTQKHSNMNYESALAVASQVVLKDGNSMLDAVNDPFIRALDRDHRIYHNFVDENGNTAPSRGTGVVDGLPQLEDYIMTGMVMLDGVEAIIAVSDGFLWPSPLHETPTQRQIRLGRMWENIREKGVRGYLSMLRAEERADSNREKYPRFKLHDDATGVVLWLNDDYKL